MPHTGSTIGGGTQALEFIRLANAQVQAFAAPIVDFPTGFRGGPVLGPEHDAFRHLRAWQPYDGFRDGAIYDRRLAGAYTYAGPLYDHFGHFISEMVHRILPGRAMGLPRRLLFVTARGNANHLEFERIPRHIRDILMFLDVSEDEVMVVDRDTIVEELFIPRQGAVLNGQPNRAYLELLRDFSSARLDQFYGAVRRPSRIYVSRGSLGVPGGILGERYLEAQFAMDGYTIFHPERHSYPEQIDHYRKADMVVFAEGSACHGAELLGSGMIRNAVLIPRTGFQTPLFRHVLEPRAVDFTISAASDYLGTLFADDASGAPLFHRGVAILDGPCLMGELRRSTTAEFTRFSSRRYRAHVALDLLRYMASHRGERWSGRETKSLLRRFRKRYLRRENRSPTN